jgi:hypothetical protein
MRYEVVISTIAWTKDPVQKVAEVSVTINLDAEDEGELLEIFSKLYKHLSTFDQYAVTKR